jgi:hypothetical protein
MYSDTGLVPVVKKLLAEYTENPVALPFELSALELSEKINPPFIDSEKLGKEASGFTLEVGNGNPS